jgi:hypothetical protein
MLLLGCTAAPTWWAALNPWASAVTLDDLSPEDLDAAARACAGLTLSLLTPEVLPGYVAVSEPELANRLVGLAPDELAVLHEYLLDAEEPAGAELAYSI